MPYRSGRKLSLALLFLLLIRGAAGSIPAWADQNYSQQLFFENSSSPDNYFYSAGRVSVGRQGSHHHAAKA